MPLDEAVSRVRRGKVRFGRRKNPDREAGRSEIIDVVLDPVDPTCGLPLTVTHMAAVVEGVVQVASRQEWSITYEVRP